MSGQDPTEILKMDPKKYGYLKLLSAILHVVIFFKIEMFKRSDKYRNQNFLKDLESR